MNFTFDLKRRSAVAIAGVGDGEIVGYMTDYPEEVFRQFV
jgi:hypothetical protein